MNFMSEAIKNSGMQGYLLLHVFAESTQPNKYDRKDFDKYDGKDFDKNDRKDFDKAYFLNNDITKLS